jgi:hypothetical protein
MLQRAKIGNLIRPKIEIVEYICNIMIDELMLRAVRGNKVRNYYDIAVLGYSMGDVRSLLPGDSEGFVAIDRLIEMAPAPKTVYIEQHAADGSTTTAPITFHEWIKPRAGGSTPMHEALAYAYTLIERWCRNLDNRYSFPPMVFHITDGDYNDAHEADILDIASRIRLTHTEDGNTLLFNIHLSSDIEEDYHEVFPHAKRYTTDRRDRDILFKMSSIIPKTLEPLVAHIMGLKRRGPYRGVIYNTSPCDLLAILNIGTESANNIRFL